MGVEVARRPRGRRAAWAAWLLIASAPFVAPAAHPPADPATDPGSALRAVKGLLDAGQPDAASTALAALEAGDLGDHVLLLKARLQLEAGDRDEALHSLARALERNPPSELRARIHRERARVYLEREDLLGAYREQRSGWESARDSDLRAELVVELARAFEARDLPGDALNLYQRAWQHWPRADPSLEAYERTEFLAAATNAEGPSSEARLKWAESLRKAYRCGLALNVYDSLLASEAIDPETRLEIAESRARCLFQRRRYNEAIVQFQALAEARPDDVELRILVARSDARLGNQTEAAEALLVIARQANRKVAARSRYLAALLLREKNPDRSSQLLRKVEQQRAAAGLSRSARWRLAWIDLQGQRNAPAAQRLQKLSRGPLYDVEVQRALYWLGIAQLRSDPKKGRATLRRIAEGVPLSYYGVLSAERLGEAPEHQKPFLGSRNGAGGDRALARARWLVEGGFPDGARDELESRLQMGRVSREQRVEAAELLHAVGDHFRAVRVLVNGFGDALEQGIDPEWHEVWRLAWPRPYPAMVHSAVQEFKGDPDLVYAVMREESTYEPEAASPAGALGLM